MRQRRRLPTYFDDEGKAPPWLAPLGELTGYIDPPHYSKFVAPLTSSVTIRGEADAILKRADGKLGHCGFQDRGIQRN